MTTDDDGSRAQAPSSAAAPQDDEVWAALYAFNALYALSGDAMPHFRAMKAALIAAQAQRTEAQDGGER